MTQQVFISYSNENETDRRVADRIYDALKAGGVPCWLAHRDIAAGQKWPTEISKAISNSRVMILVLSQHTQKSSYVEMEVTQAADEKLTIIPFCIENVSLSGGLRLLLSNCQKINAYPQPQDKDMERLVETLKNYLGIEPVKVLKKEEKVEKPLEVKKESPTKRNGANTKKFHRLKRALIAALIIIAAVVVVFYMSQRFNKRETPRIMERAGTVKPGDTSKLLGKYEESDFVKDLISKGWDVKKNESDCWEAFYKSYDLTMIYIPAGKFKMGADDGYDNEKPSHEVELDGYWIGKYEVTFAQYDRYCDETGKEKPGDGGWGRDKRPVNNVSWNNAVAYCQWLSKKTGLTFQLPTEAHWEKAARGSRGFRYPWGNAFDKDKCNSYESGLKMTMPVGSYPAGKSPYGCMDMAGNVYEWCADWYDEDYYKNSPAKSPEGPVLGSNRVLRGGAWDGTSDYLRCTVRSIVYPWFYWLNCGFRVVCVHPQS